MTFFINKHWDKGTCEIFLIFSFNPNSLVLFLYNIYFIFLFIYILYKSHTFFWHTSTYMQTDQKVYFINILPFFFFYFLSVQCFFFRLSIFLSDFTISYLENENLTQYVLINMSPFVHIVNINRYVKIQTLHNN